YVARFIGTPQMDIFAGEFVNRNGMQYQIGEASFGLPASMKVSDAKVDVGVRAEFVTLGSHGFHATIRLVQPVGPFTYVTVEWNGGSVTARVNGVSHLKPKENIKVDINPNGLLFFDRSTEKLIV
ncbi:MAG: TOBE domain-containing protein, partial [Anaerolineales bacterium]